MRNPLRRSQLIAPFGPGAMVVMTKGIGLICGGLDYWYKREDDQFEEDERFRDIEEYRIEEWRLQQRLQVTHFRLPPDYREYVSGESTPNQGLMIPFLRFPQWHFCAFCKRLEKLSLTDRGLLRCKECESKGKRRLLVQVPFIAICPKGHLQDFPWREWVHKTVHTSCKEPLRLIATGGASLSGQKVTCDCGVPARTLASITNTDTNGSFLSTTLDDSGVLYLCQGQRPWLGMAESEPCDAPLRGSLRSASNVYYADVRSAIYVPRSTSIVPESLFALLEETPLSSFISILRGFESFQITPNLLRDHARSILQPYTDEQIEAALQGRIVSNETGIGTDDEETQFRRSEFNVIRSPTHEDQLMVRTEPITMYDKPVRDYLSRIMLIDKLRETRVLAGFTRILPENDQTSEERQAMLWRKPPNKDHSWLPAYTVYGEGIYFELDESKLQLWESRLDVLNRVKPLIERYSVLQQERNMRVQPLNPRFLLLHTLSHVIMNRLTFECGYSSASLRERLYVSTDRDSPMAGILIYTAVGDAEGTMGGLVRMGKPGYLEATFQRALEQAAWCSSDPVCMEMGNSRGQGPDSCNLAACHSCALVPETACEQFNRFLDRALLIGDIQKPDIGFFSSLFQEI
ncbi:DUF1998 domain-containing protein [Herpetosiphon giganteus]|uniref:DUF1998 domain-containing protein n=1 Tax=Herpetosiphon giganteus TaxID=2029754 RepID=UPI00195D5D97|nr:DUF1998 domain-containing protein [Herpetosiphon giganteus]MBM7841619.1 hypothetical protein [Herpetosiphon giganteus]